MSAQDDLYNEAINEYGPSLERLARAYEAENEDRRDLLQEIHIAIWRSFELYNARCSVRTWIFRVAHNVAVSRVMRKRRFLSDLASLEDLETLPDPAAEHSADQKPTLDQVWELIQQLKPLDRQVIVSYLEEMDAASIGDVTGLSPQNVATRIHRIKNLLARRYQKGVSDDRRQPKQR
ncbi:MAG: sigma-70 family RNA polymerase sigma factor [Terracidiphilus sp.]